MKNDYISDISLLPDFLIIGAGKSGTTSINNYLRQHPAVFINKRKEPNFFALEQYSERDFRDLNIMYHYENSIHRLDEYQSLFYGANKNQLKGETSNTYLYMENAPASIKKYIPNVKMIAILRQPAERLYSRYKHLIRDNLLSPTTDFMGCLDRTNTLWNRYDMVPEGYYYKYLRRYFDIFDPKQFKIFLYEDFVKSPQKVLTTIFEFLEVSKSFRPDMSVAYNKTGTSKSKMANMIIGHNGLANKVFSKVLPVRLYESLRQNFGVQKAIYKMRKKNFRKQELDVELKKLVTTSIYLEDIKQLEDLISRDLTAWY